MSNSSAAVSDDKKPHAGNAANAAGGGSLSSFSIDGLLGLKKRNSATSTKPIKKQEGDGDHLNVPGPCATTCPAASLTHPTPSTATAAHLVYSSATASTVIPSSAFHSALWGSHPAAAFAAFRRK